MKIKRYNIEQLKNYSVVLSPEEQLMLLGGYKYEEGMYGVLVFDDNNNLLKIIRYEDAITNNYSELADYTLPSNITLCTLSSGMTCFVLQNTDILAQRSSFTNGFTDEMIMNLEQYNVNIYYFNENNPVSYDGKKRNDSHYNSGMNLIAMRTYEDDTSNYISIESRVHEVIHSFQQNAFHQSMVIENTMNLEYQAYVISALYAKGKKSYDSMIDSWPWINDYIVHKGANRFYVKSAIFDEINKHADEWLLSNQAAQYREKMEAKGIEPYFNKDFIYNWRALFNSLGIEVH